MMEKITSDVHQIKILRFFVLLTFLYYFPVILLWKRIIPFKYRFIVLGGMTIIGGIIYALFRGFTWHELGFRIDNLKLSLLWNVVLSVLFLIVLFVLYKSGFTGSSTAPKWSYYFVFYVLISIPAQEFAYRSLLFAEMTDIGINNPYLMIIISSTTFSFLHIIFNNPKNVSLSFLLGLIWGFIYLKSPNFWGISFSHMILGVLSIYNGIV